MITQTPTPDPSGLLSTAASIEQLGIIGILALAVLALALEWVVPGRRLRESEEQRRKSEDVADDLLAAVKTVEESTRTVVRLVEALPRARRPSREEE